MARIAGVDIPREKRLEISLTYIFGIGKTTAQKICDELELDRGTKVSSLTEDEVNQILHQSVATQEKPRPKEMFEKGERIRITEGPFASFNGVVEEVNLDRSTVKVMVTIFGRETPVEMEFRQVQKLA